MKNVREYLNKKGYKFTEHKRQSGPQAMLICPFCGGGPNHEKSFGINLETGVWNCLRNNHCGLTGTFYQLQQKLGDNPSKEKKYFTETFKPKNFVIPKVQNLPLSNKNIQYIKSRGFTEETIKQFKLFDSKDGKISFPFIKNYKQVNVKYRTIDKKFSQETGAERTLFNIDFVSGNILTITEGEFDCMALVQYGLKNITSLPSGTQDQKWIENEWEWLEKFTTIYLCMDNDTAGNTAVSLLVSRLGRWRCKSVVFPHKDANDCLKANVTIDKINECFDNAEEFPPAILKRAGNYYEEVVEMFLDPKKFNGTSTGFPGLDYYLKGWRKGEVTVWSGSNNAGKSTFLNQVMLFLAQKMIKSCMASFELKPGRYLKWAVTQALGGETQDVNKIMSVFIWMHDYLFVMDTVKKAEPKDIFEVFEYAARRHGVEHFFIDSLMKINIRGNDKYDQQSDFVAKLTDFAKEYQCHVHLVAHPRKGETDNKKTGKVDVGGAGDITNLADNVLIAWRPEEKKENEPDMVLFVKKNREFGEIGGVKLYFDKVARRFRCSDQIIDFYFNNPPF